LKQHETKYLTSFPQFQLQQQACLRFHHIAAKFPQRCIHSEHLDLKDFCIDQEYGCLQFLYAIVLPLKYVNQGHPTLLLLELFIRSTAIRILLDGKYGQLIRDILTSYNFSTQRFQNIHLFFTHLFWKANDTTITLHRPPYSLLSCCEETQQRI